MVELEILGGFNLSCPYLVPRLEDVLVVGNTLHPSLHDLLVEIERRRDDIEKKQETEHHGGFYYPLVVQWNSTRGN